MRTPVNWEPLRRQVIAQGASPQTRRAYANVLKQFIPWLKTERRNRLTKEAVLSYRNQLIGRKAASATVAQHLNVIRQLSLAAAEGKRLNPFVATQIQKIKNPPASPKRHLTWLQAKEARQLLTTPNLQTLRGKRDFAVLQLLTSCALRRAEVIVLEERHLSYAKNAGWQIADFMGKGRKRRSVPVPDHVKAAIDDWLKHSCIGEGPIFRAVSARGRCTGKGLTTQSVYNIVRQYAKLAGINRLAPHDLRRTCGRLSYNRYKDIRKTQRLLDHASALTTERYLGLHEDDETPANADIGLDLREHQNRLRRAVS